MSKLRKSIVVTVTAVFLLIGVRESTGQDTAAPSMRSALTFYASFNSLPEADVADGDANLYCIVKDGKRQNTQVGLPSDGKTKIVHGEGLGGGALRFTAKDASTVFFEAKDNLAYRERDWQGTVSLWLRLNPEDDLEPGYCDPVQITPRQWNDAAFFVDFDKEGDPRDFRLGAFADLKIWNPTAAEIPESKRPLLTVKNPPFASETWTHVVFSWSGFNGGEEPAVASFYLNGKPVGKIDGWNQQFTWGPNEECRIQIGLNYIGLFDELACFNRSLSDEEIAQLFQLRGGLLAENRKEQN